MSCFNVLCEQLQAICNDETAVEQAKKQGSHRLNVSKKALLAEVFGKGKAASFLAGNSIKLFAAVNLTICWCMMVGMCVGTADVWCDLNCVYCSVEIRLLC